MKNEEFKRAILAFVADYRNGNVRADGGPGSGNFGHAGRPGEVGGSAPEKGAAAKPEPKKEYRLEAPSKSTLNKRINEIVDRGNNATSSEEFEKASDEITDILKKLEVGSVVTVPETSYGDPKYTFKKTDENTWRSSSIDWSSSSSDVASYFFVEDESERPYISNIARSQEQKMNNMLAEMQRSWRNQKFKWGEDGPLGKEEDINLRADDYMLAGEGFIITGKNGEEYESGGDGHWYKKGSWKEAKQNEIVGSTFKGDYYDVTFGLNGMGKEQVDLLRDTVGNMPPEMRAVYENAFHQVKVNPSQIGISYFSPRTGEIYIDKAATADTPIHEFTHAFDNGSVDITYNDKWGRYNVRSASVNIDRFCAPGDKAFDEDFETMAKIVGFKTTGGGTFADGYNDEQIRKTFFEWADSRSTMKGFSFISDVISGMTFDKNAGYCVYGGHEQKYWEQPFNGQFASNQSTEYWAEYCTCVAMGWNDALDLMKQISPNRFEACEKTFKEVFK